MAYERSQIRFNELCSNSELARKRDPDLVYPAGEVFVAALVEQFGDSAPARVLRAFARPKAPKDLEGVALWQDVLQAASLSLSAAEDAYIRLLRKVCADQRAFIDSVPRLRGAAVRQKGEVTVRASFQGKRPGPLLCRLRPRADTPSEHYISAFEDDEGRFVVSASDLVEGSFWYQLGWRIPDTSQAIYEDWVEVR